jgi:hypothetical protein
MQQAHAWAADSMPGGVSSWSVMRLLTVGFSARCCFVLVVAYNMLLMLHNKCDGCRKSLVEVTTTAMFSAELCCFVVAAICKLPVGLLEIS